MSVRVRCWCRRRTTAAAAERRPRRAACRSRWPVAVRIADAPSRIVCVRRFAYLHFAHFVVTRGGLAQPMSFDVRFFVLIVRQSIAINKHAVQEARAAAATRVANPAKVRRSPYFSPDLVADRCCVCVSQEGGTSGSQIVRRTFVRLLIA
jgi:hypothetical protein